MSAKRKSFKVGRGNSFLTVYPWTHPRTGADRWRYAWRENENSSWRYVTCRSKKEAEQSAWDKLGEIDSGDIQWSTLSREAQRFLEEVHRLTEPSDWPAVLTFLESRKRSSEIVSSVQRFMNWKVESAGEETRSLANLRRVLEPMARNFAGSSIIDISPAELKTWWDGRVAGLAKKTRNDVRGALVSFWNWAVLEGIHPKESTPADRLPRVEVGHGERRVLTPREFMQLAEAIVEEWRPWLVLGAFCGLRPEEIAPTRRKGFSKSGKRGLLREEIDFRFKVIHLPAEVSKVATPRKVPLCDAALAWLEWAGVEEGQTGPVCMRNPSEEEETKRLGKVVFKTGWPQDVLRHSYGSFRNSLIRNLPQVAEEMGTSETMLRRHYHNPRTKEEGEAWFEMRPKVIRYDPMESTLDSENKKSGVR
ncbi:hypothetical protein JIN85_17255 [Luteolibacter pohnpeiensis]|uniref:Core-binding (CB) domain-containing protein n=1 Tax=Luteolibacter pohnpeiensis TaxID=454153 RepID=A0A934S7L8_9BACT|nr:hypothetical protein [Luteolibacter pohnpeiensis]MBK1884171.1 hypothetical protein [Luteolibacter pohnpeiensis]